MPAGNVLGSSMCGGCRVRRVPWYAGVVWCWVWIWLSAVVVDVCVGFVHCVVVALACRVVCVLCINLAFRRYDSRCKGLSTFVYRSRAQRHKDTHDKMSTVRFFDFNGTIRIVACSSENLPRIRKSCGK